MTVHGQQTSHAGTVVSIVRAPDYHRNSVDTGGDTGDPTLRLLDRLGADGWEVFDVREYVDGSTLWLKRRRDA